MTAEQEFCLRWNNHEANLSAVLEVMLKKEALVDVTFACDGQLLKAHRTVLSACSPYFQAMFMGTIHPHPIVILRDVKAEEFRSLIDFMYKGEVTVCQSQLPNFLRIAESLQVRGLSEKDKPATEAEPVIRTDTIPDPLTSPPGSPSGKDNNHRKKRRRRQENLFQENSSQSSALQTQTPQPGPCSSNTANTSGSIASFPILPTTSYTLIGSAPLQPLIPLTESKNVASSVTLVDSLSQYSHASSMETSQLATVKQEPPVASTMPSLVDMSSDENESFNFGATSAAANFLENALQVGGSGVCVSVSDDSSTGQEQLDVPQEPEVVNGQQSGTNVSFPLQQLRGSHITLQSSFKPVPNNPTKWLCRICHREVAHRRPHLLTHLPKSIRCRLCPQESSRPDNMRNHIKNKHPEVMMVHGEDFKTSLFADFFHNGLKKAKRKRKRT